MLFNSIEFLFFLPIVFLLYWFVFRSYRWQNLLIVLASYVFYGWWDWRFLLLIALTSFCSFLSGVGLERYEGHRSRQKLISAANIILNLSILGVFKYYNFFVESFSFLFSTMGLQLDWVTLNIVLPVGISFYTFQALSYTIDVYQHKLRATHDVVAFFAYISFFPQLVAGPIERATHLLPQFQKKRHFEYDKAVDGCRQMLWGFFKKMVIADNCGSIVTQIWGSYGHQPGFILFCGAILFTIQIYCDFSGYSDIAIGCARLFGFDLMKNFDYPHLARSIPEFWRRWHISLTTWFRDYVYFPLGGSRCSQGRAVRNVLLVWAVSGLWHGANWTFVCWGLYHGILLAIYNVLGINTKYQHIVAYGKWLPSVKEVLQVTSTFLLVAIGLVIFRAETLTDAIGYLGGMCSASLFDMAASLEFLQGQMLQLYILIPGILLLFTSEWFSRQRVYPLQFAPGGFVSRHAVVRYSIYVCFLIMIFGLSMSKTEFIYFRF
jgi:D-alanyl-lipoteichoic acid acyltransferase DltB (MBOAT superfamily)